MKRISLGLLVAMFAATVQVQAQGEERASRLAHASPKTASSFALKDGESGYTLELPSRQST